MTAHDVSAEVISPMRAVFVPKRKLTEDEERVALLEYVKALQRFDADTLRAAWAKIRETYLGSSWPAIGLIVQAARDSRPLDDEPHAVRAERPKMCWDGGPYCTRCLRKVRTIDVFIAPSADYRRDEQTRAELDIWFRSLVGPPQQDTL